MKVWEQIVARDAVLTNAVFARSLINRFLALNFPGREIAAKFELGPEKNPSPAEVAELAGKIKSAGYLVDQHALEEATGFKLVKDETPSSGVPFLNKRPSPDVTARGGDKLLDAFASDMSPLGDAVKELLKNPSKAAAEDLLERLPSLLPDDPALASILAEAMAKEFDVGSASSAAPDEPLANTITHPCPKCHRQMSADGTCTSCAKRAANHEAGKSAFERVAKTHQDVLDAMERDSIGKIDFIWGDNSEGICHILKNHPGDAQMIPGVIAYGDIYEDKVNEKYYAIKKNNLVVLRKSKNGNHYLITGYRKDNPNAIAKIRKENDLVEKGE